MVGFGQIGFRRRFIRFGQASKQFQGFGFWYGESLFLRKLLWASLPNKRQKSRDR
jgi:hypothetical protein